MKSYRLIPTRHALERMATREITLKRATQAVNRSDERMPGNLPNTKKFVGDKPPPPIAAITTWPPNPDKSLKLITCYVVGTEGGGQP